MIRPRRVHALVLIVPVLLAGCGSHDVLPGQGSPASVSSTGGFPSQSPASDTTGAPTSGPTSGPSSDPSGAAGRLVSLSALTGNATSVALDAGFVRALTALKVTPGLVGTARLTGSALVLPVTGGNITVFSPGSPQPASGSVEHAGSGLTLSSGGTTISINDLRVDLGDAPQLNGTVSANGKVVVRSVTVFDVDSESIRATGSAGTASVTGVGLRMDSGLASLLNTSFRTAAFTSGLLFGTATLTLVGR